MQKKALILIFIFWATIICGQVTFDNRNWVIGLYYGTVTRVTPSNSQTITCSAGMNIIKNINDTVHLRVEDSTCMYQYWGIISNWSTSIEVKNDSTLNVGFNIGRLYNTDSLHLDFYVGGMVPYNYYYRMHKVKSYFFDVGLHEIEALNNSILVYPNPCSEKIAVQNMSGAEVKKYSFISVDAKQVTLIPNAKEEFDVSTLPEGMYFLQLQTAVGILNKKVIVKH